MRQRMLVVAASALVLASGLTATYAQQGPNGFFILQPAEDGTQEQGMDQNRTGTTGQGGMMGQGGGMMGQGGMMGHGMMGGGMAGHGGMTGPRSAPSPMMMHILFALMDADGDGTISLQEFQAAHERIFRAMDANKDGKVTFDEMLAFMRGRPPAPQQ